MIGAPRRMALVLALALAATSLVALLVGPGGLGLGDLFRALLRGPTDAASDDVAAALVWTLRLPRALLAALVGAALASAGALTQGLFRNPLADPSVLGVSLGAALAAVAGFVLGLDAAGAWVTPLLAAGGAGATLVLLFAIASLRPQSTSLLLAGIAIGASCGALTTCLLAIAGDRFELGIKVMRWLMGSFEGRSWAHLGGAAAPIAIALVAAMALARDLDALVLGDETARSLGVSIARTQRMAMATVAVLVGAATAVAGVLGFLGLVVPHVVRWRIGAAHRHVVPLSALVGATVMLVVDTGTRVAPLPLPPGVVTSLVGAPMFLWILLRHDRSEGR
jgi:ABC-type Fe3+-siderophore transport system permease subunit